MFYDKYRQLCKSVGKSPSAVAIELGISKGTVSTWKNLGRTPQVAQLQKVADYFHITVDQLLDENKNAPVAKSHESADWKQRVGATPCNVAQVAPLLGTVRAGLPMYAEENIEGYIPIRQTDGAKYFWLNIRGDSMNAAGMNDGDQILVREQPEVENAGGRRGHLPPNAGCGKRRHRGGAGERRRGHGKDLPAGGEPCDPDTP